MMMISPSPFDKFKTRRRPRTFSMLTVVSVCFLLLCAVLGVLWHGSASSLLWRFLAPVVVLRNDLSKGEVADLRAQIASTSAALADRNALYEENVALKAQFGRDIGKGTLLAAVLEHPPGTPYDTLILDVGRDRAVREGELVSAGGTNVIGTIEDVYDTTSRVVLFSSPGKTYQAFLGAAATTATALSIAGEGGGSMSGSLPAGTPVKIGDPVFFPGITNDYIGAVSSVVSPVGESFERIYVHLPVDLFSLRYVEILK